MNYFSKKFKQKAENRAQTILLFAKKVFILPITIFFTTSAVDGAPIVPLFFNSALTR